MSLTLDSIVPSSNSAQIYFTIVPVYDPFGNEYVYIDEIIYTFDNTNYYSFTTPTKTSPGLITGLLPGTSYTISLVGFYQGSQSTTWGPTAPQQFTTTAGGGAIGDPHIVTINNEFYDLPHDENCYLLFDNNNLKDRVVITCKNWFLPKELKDNSPFFIETMDNTNFMKYINIRVNNKQLTIDMDTLKPVQYTNDEDVNDFKLEKIDFARNKNIHLDKICKDKDVFKKYYNSYKKRTFNIKFNGKSRNILLKSNDIEYNVKLALDTNCADIRNEIRIFGNFSKECTGAFISKSSAKCIPSLIYN